MHMEGYGICMTLPSDVEDVQYKQQLFCTGDYWPGEAESLLMNMGEEARLAGKKGSKPVRSAKNTKGKRYGAGPATTDTQLMEKLGDTIMGMKADFIVVHLHEPCSFCRTYISDATRRVHVYPAALKCYRCIYMYSLDLEASLFAQSI